MNVTPAATTSRNNVTPLSWSGYSPHTLGPASCIAPYPMRPTVRSPPIVTVSAICVSAGISNLLDRIGLPDNDGLAGARARAGDRHGDEERLGTIDSR